MAQLGRLMLTTLGHSIHCTLKGELAGRMAWVEHPDLYIDFLWSDRPEALAPMFAAFRRMYPDTLVFFDVAEDNERMRRFITLVGAQQQSDGRYLVNTRTTHNAL